MESTRLPLDSDHDSDSTAQQRGITASPVSEKDVEPTRTVRGFRWFLICLSLYTSIFIYGLDTTIAADVQGAVLAAFGHIEQLAWIGAGFPLGSVSVILLNGVLYTNFNMKWVYITALVLFEIGSAICGAAPNMAALIVGRVIAGAGGSGIFMGCLSFFTALTTPKESAIYITGTGFCWGIGAVLGPVVGGSFVVSSATWRWAFYINLILGAAFAPVYLFSLPSVSPVTLVSVAGRIKKIDSVGLVLFAGLWVAFTMAFTMAGGQWPWNDGRTIGTIVTFVIILITFALQQTFSIFTTKENRSFPIHLLRSRAQVLLYIGTAANITSLFVIVYFIPIYFQFVHNDSALQAAVRLLPFVVVTVTSNLSAGHLLSKIRYYIIIYVVSGVFMTIGAALLTAYLTPTTPMSYIYGFSVIAAFGTGLTLQIGYAISTLKAPNHTGDAIALQNVAQIGSSVIALVIAGQVFQSTAVRNLTQVFAGTSYTQADIQSIVTGSQSQVFEELSGPLKEAAVAAITEAMQKAFLLVCVGGGVLTVAGLLMKREKLFGAIVQVGA
jgi:MFS family permease